MEPLSYWTRFIQFVRESITQKFKAFYPGVIVGLLGSKSLLFSGLPSEMVTLGAYCLKYIGTVVMSFSSGLATAYAAYLIDRHKEKKSSPTGTRKRKNKAA